MSKYHSNYPYGTRGGRVAMIDNIANVLDVVDMDKFGLFMICDLNVALAWLRGDN